MPKKRLVEISDELWDKVRIYAIQNKLLIKDTPEALLKEFFKDKEDINNVTKK